MLFRYIRLQKSARLHPERDSAANCRCDRKDSEEFEPAQCKPLSTHSPEDSPRRSPGTCRQDPIRRAAIHKFQKPARREHSSGEVLVSHERFEPEIHLQEGRPLPRSLARMLLFAFVASAVLAGSALLVVSKNDPPASANDPANPEDLIEAVMFNTGPMVKDIDAIDGTIEETLTAQQYVGFRSFARDIIEDAVAADPAAMNAAVVDLQSGNPSMVDRAIG